MNTSIMVIIVMGLFGILFGVVLAVANKKLAIEVNPLIEIVDEVLPKGQCGACGYAGCMAYAEAVVTNPEVSPNLCVPGKEEVAYKVAELTGKAAGNVAAVNAQVRCAGSKCKAIDKYKYDGVEDCIAANLLMGGAKGCQYGCLGFGTCVNSCPFDAMIMSEEGLPIIDLDLCTGCGKCESVCPKKIIHMVPEGTTVRINCSSKDKGPIARKQCTVACIGCGLCSRNCSYGAIKIENNLAIIDSHICISQCSEPTCLIKCPTGAIRPVVSGVVPGNEVIQDRENAVREKAV
jgi:Na+-translocating ferredoxin:NAD+ oxidoreductase subunit B